jgi:ATP-dependent RNA helicase DeaD
MTQPAPPTFESLPLSPEVRKAVEALGWVHPTPVQNAVLEPATRGKSLVVQARTGTGKTGAFGLPIVDQLVRRTTAKVQALILTPTRELALQVAREIEHLGQFRGVKVTAIYGGAPMGRQVDALQQGTQVVCGTPGRVLDHIRRGTLDTSQIRIFVLDEADEMLSMGFAKELHAICDALPKERQGLFFSATIPPDIERLAVAQLKDPEFIILSSDQVGALEINHYVYIFRGRDKRQELVRILEIEDPESAIIFCNTRDETERVAEALKNQGYDADWLNGDLEQRERERIMQATREGRLRFLVATDVAARGIDISHLTHVINADFPESAEQYVHRTGRTGRAGKTGTAISLVTPKDIGSLYILRLTYKIRPIERQLPTAGELKTRAETDLIDTFVEAFATREIHTDDLALARRLLTHNDAEKIVAGLMRDHLGERPGDPAQLAAEARRAKNPPPERREPEKRREKPRPAPAPAPEAARAERPRPEAARAEGPRPEGPRPEGSRPEGPRPEGPRPEAARGEGPRPEASGSPRGERRRKPHASFATWEPPSERDDDAPILPGITVHDTDEPPPMPRAQSRERDDEVEEGFAQIYVNVGRRDGVKPGDFVRLLEGSGSLERGDTGRIRIRDRNSFVSVKKEQLERAVAALSGQTIAGRAVTAEPAKKGSKTGSERDVRT